MRVQLARIEGKQDVTNERLETANRVNAERHASVSAQIATIDARLTAAFERIMGLEKREIGRDGERKGVALSGRVLWALIGFVPGAAVAAVKLLGL